MKNKIWFDITNTPQVHFLLGIKNGLNKINNDFEFIYSCREFSETVKLLKQKIDKPYINIGGHYGKSKFKKALGIVSRFNQLILQKEINFDVSISCGSEAAILISKLRNKKSIAFGDNDTAPQWTYSRFVDYAFFPNAIPKSILTKQGLNENKLYLYNGYKEDIYIADFNPDPEFLDKIPFKNYVLVRPENIMANYIRKNNIKSIVPELLKKLVDKGINILYLPRYNIDFKYADNIKNIFIPDKPLNGLDACYYADAVLTGAGTFAREASCLGVPSVSFYAGQKLLAVDQKLIKEKKMFFSREPKEIIDYIIKSDRNVFDLNRSKEVKKEVISKLLEIFYHFDIQ